MSALAIPGLLRYEVWEEPVGSGTYGVVFRARDRISRRYVALKRIKQDLSTKGVPSSALREIGLLREMRHRNVVE